MKKTIKAIAALFTAAMITLGAGAQKPSPQLLTPANHTRAGQGHTVPGPHRAV